MYPLVMKAARFKTAMEAFTWNTIKRRRLAVYLRSDRRPWSTGYDEYRQQSLIESINNESVLEAFAACRNLPKGYGFRLDARLVEIPWVLARTAPHEGSFMDAGSALNYDFVLKSEALKSNKVTIVTLAPEGQAFWRLGVSYVFGDLRDLDFRNDRFDAIACISTIEHIGMDNSMYAGDADIARRGDPKEFLLAAKELKRVLKPDGTLYITFPFGRYENHGWFQQFDAALLDQLVEGFGPAQFHETIFKYEPDGWQLSNRAACADCQFFDVHESKYCDPESTIEYPNDYPAGERALACLELRK